MSEDLDYRPFLESLAQDPEFRREAAQIQAKALLSEVAQTVPAYRWTYIAQRVVRNIVLATAGLETIAESEPDDVEAMSQVARRVALIWESLSQLQEGTSRDTAIINAAVNYELAGYQANATCLANQIDSVGDDAEIPPVVDMTRRFLQRRFLQLLELARRALREPRADQAMGASVAQAIATGLAARAFIHSLEFFFWGDSSALRRALTDLKNSEEVFSSLGLVEDSNLVRGVRSLLPIIGRRSTWTILGDLAPEAPLWRRYLKLLARGLGPSVYGGRSVVELWPSQVSAVHDGVVRAGSNKIIKMPTSAGKTRIAEMAIVHTLVNTPGAKAVYVAPYRALVSELERSLYDVIADLGYRVSSVTGTYESDDFEALLSTETDVLVTTPEKADLLLRARPEFLRAVRLVVLDEAQIVDNYRRGVKFELLLTRLMRRLSGARFLTLWAVVPQQTLDEFATWFRASPSRDVVTSTWRPSVQRYAKFEWLGTTGVLRYAPQPDVTLLNEFVPGVVRQRQYEYVNPGTGRINRKRFPDVSSKAQTAAELAYRFSELGPVLVFCAQANWAKAVASALHSRLQLGVASGEGIPARFRVGSRTRSALLAEEWLGDRPMTSWLRLGVGVHYGDLPDVIRHAVETDFRQRRLPVLVATSTLAQGVNLPVRTVIVHSCWRYEQERHQRILAREYWNIAGRAGRAGEETEGLIIHLATRERDTEDFEYYLAARDDIEPVQSALFQKLADLVNGRLSEEALRSELDPEILALVVEEGAEMLVEDGVARFLSDTLTHLQARRDGFPTDRLTQVMTGVATAVVETVPDPDDRSVYSRTGLSTGSCMALRAHAQSNESVVRSMLLSAGPERLEESIAVLLPACLQLSEMQPEQEFGGSYEELLTAWIAGTEMRSLMSDFGDQFASAEQLGLFLDDVFRYRLPWGISGYIRIAMRLLGVQGSQLSAFMRFLPSMVKYGVPNPMASWAMAVGIPFRRTAIDIAAAYCDEIRSPGFEEFLGWLSTISSERLHYEFGLASPLLEDVTRAIFTVSGNPLIRHFTGLDSFLPQEVEVRGITYEDSRRAVALTAQAGQPVDLRRDYDNLADRNAIAVDLLGQQMGYVPRDVAQVLAPEMDTGVVIRGVVLSTERRPVPRVLVRIGQGRRSLLS